MFTTSTTVSVPDRGSVFMGGIKRGSTGRNEFGVPMLGKLPYLGPLFKNSGIGSEYSASNMHVSVFIHDFEAMEEALLGQSATSQSLAAVERAQPRSALAAYGQTLQPRNPSAGRSWHPASLASTPSLTPMSAAEARAERLAEQQTRADEALSFFQRGQQAEAEGKANVAKIYYQMCARRASGSLKEQVLARLDVIGRAQTGSQVAESRP
jgi:hypothetical protein